MDLKALRQAKFTLEDLLEYNTIQPDQERILTDAVDVVDDLLTMMDEIRDDEMRQDMGDYEM